MEKNKKKESKAGKPDGLVLLLDPNPYSYKVNMGDQSYEQRQLKVYVHTLAQYTAYGPGTYALSSLKRMTGTESFRELPDNQKRCRVHSREDCQTKNFLDQVWNKCQCVPWALVDGTSLSKVGNTSSFFQQEPNVQCGPESEGCVANQTLKDESCLVPCSGLYADIADDLHYQLNRQYMADLVKDLEQSMSKGKEIQFAFSH